MVFDVIGKIKGKERPRWSSRSKSMYTPTGTLAYEKYIKESYIEQGGKMLNGAMRVNIEMYFSIPRDYSKEDKELCKLNAQLPQKKPDIDNIIKVVLDGLNGVAYEDDKQVAELTAIKRWTTDEERLIVEITDIRL